MAPEIKKKVLYVIDIFNPLIKELQKDFIFFGSCGFFTGILAIGYDHFKAGEFVQGNSFAERLFDGFVSPTPFVLVLHGLVVFTIIDFLIYKILKVNWQCLNNTIEHIKLRLIQIASTFITYTIGLAVMAFLYHLIDANSEGWELVVIILIFNLFIISILFIILSFEKKIRKGNS